MAWFSQLIWCYHELESSISFSIESLAFLVYIPARFSVVRSSFLNNLNPYFKAVNYCDAWQRVLQTMNAFLCIYVLNCKYFHFPGYSTPHTELWVQTYRSVSVRLKKFHYFFIHFYVFCHTNSVMVFAFLASNPTKLFKGLQSLVSSLTILFANCRKMNFPSSKQVQRSCTFDTTASL